MPQKFEYTVLDLIENAARNVKTAPLNLGGVAGVGGGAGGPPGGFIGWLPQTRVAYDMDELGTLATVGSGTLLDNLNHIRYRLDVMESGGGGGGGGITFSGLTNAVVLTDGSGDLVTEPWLRRGSNYVEFGANVGGKETNAGKIGYQVFSTGLDILGAGTSAGDRLIKLWDDVEIGDSLQVDSLAGTGDRSIGVDSDGKLKVLAVTVGDTTYLRLDGTNSPMTGELQVIPTTPGTNGLYVETAEAGQPGDFEQYTNTTDITSDNVIFMYRNTFGTGDISSVMLEGWEDEDSSGVITGDWVKFTKNGTVKFRIANNGDVYSNGELLIPEAPLDGDAYLRQNGMWVSSSGVVIVGSGGSGSFTIVNDNTATTYLAVDTIHFSGAGISTANLGGGDVQVSLDVLSVADPYGLHHRLSGSHSDDDEFSSDTSANYTTQTPTGTASWSIGNHSLGVQFNGNSSSDLCCFLKPLTIADGEWIETTIRMLTQSANYSFVGLCFTNGTATSSSIASACFFISSALPGRIDLRYDTGTITNLTSSASDTAFDLAITGTLRLRFKRISSTSYKYYVANQDGSIYYDWGAGGVNPGFTPTHAGFCVSTWGGSHKGLASFDYFRHMS